MLFHAPWLDGVAGFIVAGMIAQAGYSIGKDSLQDLTDRSIDTEVSPPFPLWISY
jgi:divalent metal cation (Fe/Co/Zn/Cd) transporter